MDSPPRPPDWNAIAQKPGFKTLLRHKAKFIITATIFFVVYYFALLILVGYFPELMKKPVWGKVNWAYAFALSQFFMAWIVALLYMRAASGWDKESAAIISNLEER